MAISVSFANAAIMVPGMYGHPSMYHKSLWHWSLYKLLNKLQIVERDHKSQLHGAYTTWYEAHARR